MGGWTVQKNRYIITTLLLSTGSVQMRWGVGWLERLFYLSFFVICLCMSAAHIHHEATSSTIIDCGSSIMSTCTSPTSLRWNCSVVSNAGKRLKLNRSGAPRLGSGGINRPPLDHYTATPAPTCTARSTATHRGAPLAGGQRPFVSWSDRGQNLRKLRIPTRTTLRASNKLELSRESVLKYFHR